MMPIFPKPSRRNFIMLLLVSWLLVGGLAHAQDELTLRLRKNYGYAAGNQIQGRFTVEASGPANISRVLFFLNDAPIGEVDTPPFALAFDTGGFDPGPMTLSAQAFTDDGRSLTASPLQREIVTADEVNSLVTGMLLRLGLPLLLLFVVGIGLVSWLGTRKGETGVPNANKWPGATICPKCERPFSLHVWKLNLGLSALDRCPHCGKWVRVRRVTQEAIDAALAEDTPVVTPAVDFEKQLEDSRYVS